MLPPAAPAPTPNEPGGNVPLNIRNLVPAVDKRGQAISGTIVRTNHATEAPTSSSSSTAAGPSNSSNGSHPKQEREIIDLFTNYEKLQGIMDEARKEVLDFDLDDCCFNRVLTDELQEQFHEKVLVEPPLNEDRQNWRGNIICRNRDDEVDDRFYGYDESLAKTVEDILSNALADSRNQLSGRDIPIELMGRDRKGPVRIITSRNVTPTESDDEEDETDPEDDEGEDEPNQERTEQSPADSFSDNNVEDDSVVEEVHETPEVFETPAAPPLPEKLKTPSPQRAEVSVSDVQPAADDSLQMDTTADATADTIADITADTTANTSTATIPESETSDLVYPSSASGESKKKVKHRLTETDRLLTMDFGPKEGGCLGEFGMLVSDKRRRTTNQEAPTPVTPPRRPPPRRAAEKRRRTGEDIDGEEVVEDERKSEKAEKPKKLHWRVIKKMKMEAEAAARAAGNTEEPMDVAGPAPVPASSQSPAPAPPPVPESEPISKEPAEPMDTSSPSNTSLSSTTPASKSTTPVAPSKNTTPKSNAPPGYASGNSTPGSGSASNRSPVKFTAKLFEVQSKTKTPPATQPTRAAPAASKPAVPTTSTPVATTTTTTTPTPTPAQVPTQPQPQTKAPKSTPAARPVPKMVPTQASSANSTPNVAGSSRSTTQLQQHQTQLTPAMRQANIAVHQARVVDAPQPPQAPPITHQAFPGQMVHIPPPPPQSSVPPSLPAPPHRRTEQRVPPVYRPQVPRQQDGTRHQRVPPIHQVQSENRNMYGVNARPNILGRSGHRPSAAAHQVHMNVPRRYPQPNGQQFNQAQQNQQDFNRSSRQFEETQAHFAANTAAHQAVLQQAAALHPVPRPAARQPTPPTPQVPREPSPAPVEPTRPVKVGLEGGEVFIPPGRTSNFLEWTAQDVVTWTKNFLPEGTSQATFDLIIREDIDGGMMDQFVERGDPIKNDLPIVYSHYVKIKKHASSTINHHNQIKYERDLREYTMKKAEWDRKYAQ